MGVANNSPGILSRLNFTAHGAMTGGSLDDAEALNLVKPLPDNFTFNVSQSEQMCHQQYSNIQDAFDLDWDLDLATFALPVSVGFTGAAEFQ